MSLLPEITLFLGAAIVMVLVFKRLGLGSVLGYLAAGIALGPTGLAVVDDPEALLHIAEFGVVMLLFLIGLELEPKRLWEMRAQVFGTGAAQVIATAALAAGALLALGVTWQAAAVLGCGLSLSSTAFAIQAMRERKEMAQPHGRTGFAVLLFQDLAVIPMLAVLPFLAPAVVEAVPQEGSALGSVLRVIAVLVGLVLAGRFLLRPVFKLIANAHNHELTMALALFVVVGTASLMEAVGLSMALGTFIAGMLLADSEYKHELESHIAPFEGLLLGLFFMSVGMTANVRVALTEPGLIASGVVALVGAKFAILYALGRLSKLGHNAALRLGVMLSQGGEFGFVLFAAATQGGILTQLIQDRALVIVTLSMMVTPILLVIFDRTLFARPDSAAAHTPQHAATTYEESPVIIAGFGRYGQMTGRTLRMLKIPFTALDKDAIHIDFVSRFGNKIYYGDATRLELLRAAKAEHARVLVIAVDDVEASVQIAQIARDAFPHLKILARARNRPHAFKLLALGVHDIRRETQASALETAQQALIAIDIPPAEAERFVARFREHDEETLLAQASVAGDEARLLETSQQAAARLERLFEGDGAA